jgi:hypothetical protein
MYGDKKVEDTLPLLLTGLDLCACDIVMLCSLE